MTFYELKEKYPRIPDPVFTFLDRLDPYTYNHSLRVCEIGSYVERLHPNTEGYTLSEAGLVHDVGKYFLSQHILGKYTALNSIEREAIDTHAYLSYKTLEFFGLPEDICLIALYHHNLHPRVFGISIPACTDENIMNYAKILRTIDIFEAVTSDRPYHRGYSNQTAVKDILESSDCDPETIHILRNAKELERQ